MKRLIYEEGKRYIIPTSDWGFKRLFATEDNKDLLIGLLNRVIEGPEIEDLEYMDRELQLPIASPYGAVLFDVYCRCCDGSRIIVEMQNYASTRFLDRAIVYTAASILEGFIKNDRGEYNVQRTYLIAITGTKMFPEVEIAPVKLGLCGLNVPGRPLLSDKVLQIFIELPKFAGEVEALRPEDGFLEKFAVALKTMNDSDERPDVMDDDYLVRLYKAADLHRYSEQERNEYQQAVMNSLEYKATLIDYKLEGRAEALLETARKMKANGIPLEMIAKCTDLDAETLASL